MISNYPFARAFTTEPMVSDVWFSGEEIDKMTALFSKDELRQADLIGGSIDESTRISKVKFYYPEEETSWIFDKLNEVIDLNNQVIWDFDLNGYENFQYTEYHAEQGGKYDFHADIDYTDRRAVTDPQTRKLSLTLVLNEPGVDFEGGEFQILIGSKPVTLPQAKGMVLLFPSWIIHRVTPVTKGVRKSIVVWVTGPKFK